MAVGAYPTDKLYVIGGFADTNRNPAVNPAESSIWVLGLRLRLAF